MKWECVSLITSSFRLGTDSSLWRYVILSGYRIQIYVLDLSNDRPNEETSMYQWECCMVNYGIVSMLIRISMVAGKKSVPKRESKRDSTFPLFSSSIFPHPSAWIPLSSFRPFFSYDTSPHLPWISDCRSSSDSSTDNERLVSLLLSPLTFP